MRLRFLGKRLADDGSHAARKQKQRLEGYEETKNVCIVVRDDYVQARQKVTSLAGHFAFMTLFVKIRRLISN